MTVLYNGAPGELLTYTSPSPKLTRQSDGVYRYQAHNLYLNSAAPANQSITVVSGATYEIVLTGSVSITLSGATTGTVTAGTTAFTAGTTTLTCGSTSGSGTVAVRRTPCSSTYLATTSAARYGLPFGWDTSGVLQGILVEPQATNLFLNSSVGATQTVTVSNGAAYTVSFFGTGSITFSGANSSTLSGTGATDRVSTTFTTGSTSLTCTVTGSITDVQVETGTVATSPIITYGSTVTRAADNISLPTSAFPYNQPEGTVFVVAQQKTTTNGSNRYVELSAGSSARVVDAFPIISGGNKVQYYNGTTSPGSSNTFAEGVAVSVAVAYKTGDYAGVLNGGTPFTATSAVVNTATAIYIGKNSSGAQLNGYIQKIMYVPRRMTNAELQTLTT